MAEPTTIGTLTYENPMRVPKIAKVVVNIGVGEAGEKLAKAEKVLEQITGKKPSRTIAKVHSRDWAIRKGQPIGARVTLRGADVDEFLERAFWVRQHKMPDYAWDDWGNLNFGIADHTDFQGMKYDPDIGIFGMDIAVVLERPGNRIKRRRLLKRSVPETHRVDRNEGIAFLTEKFNLEVL